MENKKVSVLGSGMVGKVLADGFLKHGYEVMRGSRDAAKLADWKAGAGDRAQVGTFAEAAAFAPLLVLAVKGNAAESALSLSGDLSGKTIIDATNPIEDAPPENGVIRFFTGINDSLMERLQKKFPSANLVKAFSCVGNAFMVNPDFGGQKPSMFICGDNEGAKADVKGVLDLFGWETEDMGACTAARAIEPLCMLWCIPGMRGGGWSHAFKLLRK